MSLFRLEGITGRRGGRIVLDRVDAELHRGATCIWGASGAGKSTLLRLLNRLADPDAGRVLLDGADIRDLDVLELRRRVVLAPQLPSPFPGTVADNVCWAPALARHSVDVARVLDLVALPAAFAERDASALSVGEQQRLSLARALALRPEVVLVDEPTSALDDEARESIEQTLIDLRDSLEVSLVIVTHSLGQARRLAQWVVELEDGRVRREGAAAELLAR